METTDAYYKDLIGKTYSLDDNNLWKGFMIVVYAMVIYNPGHNIMGTFEFSGFLGKILKMLLLFAPFSPKSVLGM